MNSSTARSAAVAQALPASRALLGVIARSLAPVMDVVTLPQFRVLVVLSDHGPLRMSDVSAKVGANPSSFSRFADRMVTAGLIVREQSSTNRREVIVSLSELGRSVHDSVTRVRESELAALMGSLPEAEQEAVKKGFGLFARAAGEPSTDELLVLGL